MQFRNKLCNDCSLKNLNEIVDVSGWVHNKRDHGGVLFVEIRDESGIVQVVFDESKDSKLAEKFSKISLESCVKIKGKIISRSEETKNLNLNTGEIEIEAISFEIFSIANVLPFQVNENEKLSDEVRLKYRFLDLRRTETAQKIILRNKMISFIRKEMEKHDFMEFQTPILTSSSPEGARDFVVPSSKHKGKFYALPQAPQQFKQLIMCSGFPRYFQIAPCFRDEAQRADRSPGEFYQLDIEMAFATQEDVFLVVEDVVRKTFEKFSEKSINKTWTKIPYNTSMLKYGSDKPDLRNPIEIFDVSKIFENSGFAVLENVIKNGGNVRAIPVSNSASQPRSFFDGTIEFAQKNGAKGLAWVKIKENFELDGVPAKFISEEGKKILQANGLKAGDSVFFASGKHHEVSILSGLVRKYLGEKLDLIDKNKFEFAWIVDFPYFEYDEKEKKIIFSHNPFSMPRACLEDLNNKNKEELLNITAHQYDLVCNGIELSSGAVRNYKLEIMYKAFEICGYSKESVDENFQALVKAFKFGPPPHAGIAPGIDRMAMLLTDSDSIKDIVLFPMTGSGEDLLMNAPSKLTPQQLKELGIEISKEKN